MNIRIEKETGITPELFWLYSNGRLITQVFLLTDEFEDGEYALVTDITNVNENTTGHPIEDFFFDQYGYEAWCKEIER